MSYTDAERLEFYVKVVAGLGGTEAYEDRLFQSNTDDDGNPRAPVWFWECDESDAVYPTFQEAIDAAMTKRK